MKYHTLNILILDMAPRGSLVGTALPSNCEEFIFPQEQLQEASPTFSDPSYVPQCDQEPHVIQQSKLNDLVHHCSGICRLMKQEYPYSGIGTNNFLDIIRMQDSLCFYSDVNGLMEELGFPHHPEEWRLFINASKLSLKTALLLNGNIKPSTSVAHSVAKKESY
jgi:hypothetical protein